MTDIETAVEMAMQSVDTNPETAVVEDEIHVPDPVDPFAGFEDEPEFNGPKDEVRLAVEKAFDEVKAAKKPEASDKKPDPLPEKEGKGARLEQNVGQEEARDGAGSDDSAPEDKADNEVSAKAEVSAAEKPADGQVSDDDRQSEGRKYAEAPARFLPKSREVWANVPNAVKADFHRISQEYDNEVAAYKQNAQSYEEIRPFDEMARSAGTSLKAALSNYVQLETLLRSDPVAGVSAVLSAVGLTPADYVSRVTGQHNGAQPQPVTSQGAAHHDNRLEQQINSLNANMERYHREAEVRAQHDAVNNNVVAPFARENARYHELEGGIVSFLESGLVPENMSARDRLETAYSMAEFAQDAPRFNELKQDVDLFLQSGRIPSSLNARERLEAAYDMAERINPLSMPAHSRIAEAIPDSRPVNLDGKKSIKGSATPGKSRSVPHGFKADTVDDAVRAAMAQFNIS